MRMSVMIMQADGQVWTVIMFNRVSFKKLHCVIWWLNALHSHNNCTSGKNWAFKNYPFNITLWKYLLLKNLERSNCVDRDHFFCVQHNWNLCCHGNYGSSWLITRAVVAWVSIHDKRLLILKHSLAWLPWEPERNAFKNSVPQTGRQISYSF